MLCDPSTNGILLLNENEVTALLSPQRTVLKFTQKHRRLKNDEFSSQQASSEND